MTMEASVSLYKDIFNLIRPFLGLLTPDGTLVEINQAALDFSGLTQDEVLGKPLWEGGWWRASAQRNHNLQETIRRAAQGVAVHDEVRISSWSGKELALDFWFRPLRDERGEVQYILVDGRDHTEYRRTIEALQTEDRLLHLAVTGAPIALSMIDRSGAISLSIGKGAERLTRPRSTIIGRSIYEVYAGAPQVLRNFERALQGEAFEDHVRLDGVMFDSHYFPVRDEQGQVQRVIVVSTDVTDQKKAEEALVESEARFSTIFQEAGIGIVIEDAQGRILDSNPKFLSMLDYTLEELRQRWFSEVTHPQDVELSQKFFDELVSGKRESYQIVKRYLRKDGEVVWGRMITAMVRTPDGKPRFMIGTVEDITAQKQIEADLIEVQRRLLQEREMERLHLAQELHDGPLQDIIGVSYQLEALEDALEEESDLAQLRVTKSALEELTRTVRAICGELRPPALAPFGLEKAIRSHVQSFQETHPEYRVVLNLAHDRHILPEETRLALFRIYQESMNNILRHAQASTIWVRFLMDEEQAVLEIQDDGKGFLMPERGLDLAREGHLGLVGAIERAEAAGENWKSSPNRATAR